MEGGPRANSGPSRGDPCSPMGLRRPRTRSRTAAIRPRVRSFSPRLAKWASKGSCRSAWRRLLERPLNWLKSRSARHSRDDKGFDVLAALPRERVDSTASPAGTLRAARPRGARIRRAASTMAERALPARHIWPSSFRLLLAQRPVRRAEPFVAKSAACPPPGSDEVPASRRATERALELRPRQRTRPPRRSLRPLL